LRHFSDNYSADIRKQSNKDERISENPSPHTFISLFCGCGGMDLGLIQAGYRCLGAYDIDPHVIEVHNFNLDSPAEVSDLSKLPVITNNPIDIVASGSPCQGFSTIGKRRLDDPRNELIVSAGHIAVSIHPKVFVAENVTGVISGKHRTYWERLRNILESNGYRTLDLRLEGDRLGLAQKRKRIFMTAWLKKCDFHPKLPESDGIALRDVLIDIDGEIKEEDKKYVTDTQISMIVEHIKPGQKLSNVRGGPRSIHTWDIPEVFGITDQAERDVLVTIMRLRRRYRVRDWGDADPVPISLVLDELGLEESSILDSLIHKRYLRKLGTHIDLKNTFNGKFRRLAWNEASPTVDTRFGDPKYFLHPDEDRAFTVREAARIQGFPDWFVFKGSAKKQYQMIGNAVPPPMAKYLAVLIEELL